MELVVIIELIILEFYVQIVIVKLIHIDLKKEFNKQLSYNRLLHHPGTMEIPVQIWASALISINGGMGDTPA